MEPNQCYHCGLPVLEGSDFKLLVLSETREMCCHGCQAVAQAIVDNGLEDYYRYRTDMPRSGEELVPDELIKLDLYNHPEVQRSFVYEEGGSVRQASLILEGITCAACIWLNERHLKQLPGVKAASVNYASHRARVTWDNSVIELSTILAEIRKLGYYAHPFNVQQQEDLRKQRQKLDFRRMAVAGLSAGQVMMLAVALYAGDAQGMELGTKQLLRWFSLLLTAPAMFYAALPFYQSAWKEIRLGRANMDVPISIGLISGFLGSLWATIQGDGAVYYDTITMLIFFLLATRFLERGAREKSVEAAENLLRLAPAMATKISDGVQSLVPVMDLAVGDLILVRPGETIAADGAVVNGTSSVDESLLTGESRPLSKMEGNPVIAGSINYESPLTIQVSGVGENTVLAGIARLLDRAQAEKPHLARMADQVASKFTYALLIIVVLVGLYWWAVHPERALEVVLSVLVVSCPCALSLAAPAAFAAASSHLVSRGVLLTRGHALETLARATRFVFDKTGTLTEGQPVLIDTIVFTEFDASRCLITAASLEQHSEHPIARGFLKAVENRTLLPVQDTENWPGRGMTGLVDGAFYTLGNMALHQGVELPEIPADRLPPGASVIWLCHDTRVLAAFVFADKLRPQSIGLIQSLKSAGMKVSMLSGDAQGAVSQVAQTLGLEDSRAELSPSGKLDALHAWQEAGDVVAMIGDGINDAPVLAGAPVSIAMGGGTQMARASGDIVLLSENLLEIGHARHVSRFAMSVVRQNFLWALAYNLIALPFAACGLLSPWISALGMSLSSLVVVLNALRLRSQS